MHLWAHLGWLALTFPLVLLGSPERMVEAQAPALIPLAVAGLAETIPIVGWFVVLANGFF
ncbi:MAG: hypothetical protein HYT88_06220 [Candidatus Omnitrophica bacterium]|nr:hypothetical protein [Candidatus Omnitrophota bacterium]